MAVGGHFKSDLWVLMANNLEHVQTYSILTFSKLRCHFPIWHTRFCGWRFSCKDPLVSVHWEYRGNFLGVYFKVSTINPFLGSNFRTNEFKWSKYRRQCWYSLWWCDSSFLACSPYTSGLEQWVLDFSPNLSQKEKRYTLAILFGI